MIANNSLGGTGSQKTQTTAHTNNESANTDQYLQGLIDRMQSLPASTPWSEKSNVLRGNITRLATTQTGSKYLQNNLLTKANP